MHPPAWCCGATENHGPPARSSSTNPTEVSPSTRTRSSSRREAVLIALDARTGRELWQKEIADNKAAYYTTLAPLIADGKVMVGTSGGETGIRGFVAAFDPGTGREL